MKVTFTNTDVKKSFMKQLSKLKDVDKSSPFKNISISHDMTKNERDQNKAMFEETKRLNSSLMKRVLNSSNLFMKLSAFV
jgi:hypothetical protein